jgi:hypothetical protein
MKEVFKGLAIFAILTVVFSALYSCSGNRTAAPEPGNQPQVSSTTQPDNSGEAKTKGADYPPVPSCGKATIKNLDGDLHQPIKGKVVLLNLWGPGAAPALMMPELVKMRTNFAIRLESSELILTMNP